MQLAVRGAPLPGVVDAPAVAPTQAVIEEWLGGAASPPQDASIAGRNKQGDTA